LLVVLMAASLDNDVRALKEWLSSAWFYLADPTLTTFDRRETRNYMKEAELALCTGLKRIADRDRLGWRSRKRASPRGGSIFALFRLMFELPFACRLFQITAKDNSCSGFVIAAG
jgi:hypothetical protein